MPTTLNQVDICNMALARIGVKPIADILTPDDIPAEQCRINWQEAFGEVARSHAWNCLLKPAVLVQVAQDPINPPTPAPTTTPWAPGTVYAVGDYVTFGDPAYLYQCLIANTATASFTNDLTAGYWFQTDVFNPDPFGTALGWNYPSGWSYKYDLPADLLLLVAINERPYEGVEEEWEIMGTALYTNEAQCIIKYVWADPDTTHYDTLLVNCLALKLAEMLATVLRQDDTTISQQMLRLYSVALAKARAKDAGERKPRRFQPAQNSRFINSRYFSTNH